MNNQWDDCLVKNVVISQFTVPIFPKKCQKLVLKPGFVRFHLAVPIAGPKALPRFFPPKLVLVRSCGEVAQVLIVKTAEPRLCFAVFFLQRSLLRGFRESHPTNIKTTPQHATSNTKPGGLGGWESTHAIPWEDVLRYTCLKMRWLFPIDKTSLGHTSHMHYSRSILLYLYMILHSYSCFIM